MEQIGQYFGICRMAVSKRHNRVIKKLKELMATWVPFSMQKIFDKGLTPNEFVVYSFLTKAKDKKNQSYHIGAMIIAEIGDFNNFDNPDEILVFSVLSPFTYQSGQLTNCYAHMEKRGSKYLRYALFNAAKKLVRLIFALEKSGHTYKA